MVENCVKLRHADLREAYRTVQLSPCCTQFTSSSRESSESNFLGYFLPEIETSLFLWKLASQTLESSSKISTAR